MWQKSTWCKINYILLSETLKYNNETKINLMQDLLHIIIFDCKLWRCDKSQFDARFITYNYLRLYNMTMWQKSISCKIYYISLSETVKSDDVTKINLMQDLLQIIILDCKIWRCDKNQFDARFTTYNYLILQNPTMEQISIWRKIYYI